MGSGACPSFSIQHGLHRQPGGPCVFAEDSFDGFDDVGEPDPPGMEGHHGFLVRGVEHGREGMPCLAASLARPTAGNAVASSGSKVQLVALLQSQALAQPGHAPASQARGRWAGACPAARPGQSWIRRRIGPWSAPLTAGRPRRRSSPAGCRRAGAPRSPQPLVDQARGVGGDHEAHVPRGVGQGVLRRDVE